MKLVARIAYFVVITSFFLTQLAWAEPPASEIENLRIEWATAKYQSSSKNQQLAALDRVIHHGKALNQQFPNDPSVMVWYATALSTYASIKGGLGELGDVKKARALLEQAININRRIENGFALGVLGTLYARVPGWPIAFGSKTKARQYLEQAIQIDPRGMDTNYYYGDFLVDVGDYENARKHLEIAQQAPIRSDHQVQDQGRKREIATSLGKLRRLER